MSETPASSNRDLAQLFREAFDKALAADRPDLVARLIDGLDQIIRNPIDRPQGGRL